MDLTPSNGRCPAGGIFAAAPSRPSAHPASWAVITVVGDAG